MDPRRIYRDFPSDVLVNILGRLPPRTRRRLRLVCRHWRHVVDWRTPTDMRSRAKTLVVATGSAYVVDDLSAPGSIRGLWSNFHTARRYLAMSVVGTCNGLVCLCDGREPGGAITVANPVTGEALTIPPLPLPPPCTVPNEQDIGSIGTGTSLWHQAYSFVYLQTMERYKIVHIPCNIDRFVFDAVHVFTLGEPSWRAVPAGPAARCDPGHGVVSVDAASATATYWATPEGTEKVWSFNLEDGRVTSVMTLPFVLSSPRARDGCSWHLADVQGRLGIVVRRASSLKTEVWVMEGMTTRGQQIKWSRWYIVQMSSMLRRLTRPAFVHGGHVLTWGWWRCGKQGSVLCRHRPSDDIAEAKRGVVEFGERNLGTVVAKFDMADDDDRRTFEYIETKEPLSVYLHAGGSTCVISWDWNP